MMNLYVCGFCSLTLSFLGDCIICSSPDIWNFFYSSFPSGYLEWFVSPLKCNLSMSGLVLAIKEPKSLIVFAFIDVLQLLLDRDFF